jgi:hypothetical protein
VIDFKFNPEEPQLLRIAIAYDFFFENYGPFLEAAVATGKNDKELVDEIERVLKLSFRIADMFMSKVNPAADTGEIQL